MELTTIEATGRKAKELFMMSKIQNLNGTHNVNVAAEIGMYVVYDVKDTKFEWNSQQFQLSQERQNSCL